MSAETQTWPERADEVVAFMRMEIALIAKNTKTSDLRYIGFKDFVLHHGKHFAHDPENRPERDFASTTAQACFSNALMAAVANPDLTYVEGFADNGCFPVHHAWVVDQEGRVYDPTWENLEGRATDVPDTYIGVPFQTDYLVHTVIENDRDGLLNWQGDGVKLEEEPTDDMIAHVEGGCPVPEHLRGPDPDVAEKLERCS